MLVLSWSSKAQSSSSDSDSLYGVTLERPISDDSTYITFYEHFDLTEPAAFPGGDTGLMKYFIRNWTLAEDHTDKGSCRRVYMSFIIDIHGNISEVKFKSPFSTLACFSLAFDTLNTLPGNNS
jgi:hypothetical protein